MFLFKWFLWLIIYSFMGWIYESTLCSIEERGFVNRGFLNGPICPVYGFGALVCIFFLYQRTDNVILMFFGGMILASCVEYITGLLLEKLFDAKWWDYSQHRFNIHGRVSLLGAVVFSIMSILLIKYIHPFVSAKVQGLSDWAVITAAVFIFIIVMSDLYVTVHHLLLLNGRLKEIQVVFNGFLEQYARRAEELKDSLTDKFKESEYYSERIKKQFNLERFQSIRIARAFPKLRPIKYNNAWLILKNALLHTHKEN